MGNELFVKIIMAIITIISALISAYVIPFIKEKISAQKLDTLVYYVSVAVRCADQIFTKEQWQEKKQYVMDYVINVTNNKLGLSLSQEDIDIIIEGVVNETHELIKRGE